MVFILQSDAGKTVYLYVAKKSIIGVLIVDEVLLLLYALHTLPLTPTLFYMQGRCS
jgi:hypothetical protein